MICFHRCQTWCKQNDKVSGKSCVMDWTQWVCCLVWTGSPPLIKRLLAYHAALCHFTLLPTFQWHLTFKRSEATVCFHINLSCSETPSHTHVNFINVNYQTLEPSLSKNNNWTVRSCFVLSTLSYSLTAMTSTHSLQLRFQHSFSK